MTSQFAHCAGRLQELLRPYHVYPALDMRKCLDWVNAGLDTDTQIIPVIEENIQRKRAKGQKVPVSLNYWDAIIRTLKQSPEPNKINETEFERDLRLAKQYRWKIGTLIGAVHFEAERKLAALEARYGKGFGK